MATKINFKHPKYILPLIILPFIFGGYFLFGATGNPERPVQDSSTAGINVSFPKVDSSISNQAISGKFAAYQSAYLNAKEQSAMNSIYQDPLTGQVYQSIVPDEDLNRQEAKRIMDSINKTHADDIFYAPQNMPAKNKQSSFINTEPDVYMELQKELFASANQPAAGNNTYLDNDLNDALASGENSANNEYEQQMKLFREQMRMVDSMQNPKQNLTATGDNNYNNKGIRYQFTQDTGFKPVSVEAVGNKNIAGFNTIRNATKNAGKIMAMIDQDVKATAGSRVRIRLLSDMFAGDMLIPKGTYVYGMVTGFQAQRVNISVKYIAFNEQSIPVQLDLYDNDGYLGLYVPGSNFREFTKEIGSQASQGMSSLVMADGSNVVNNILAQIFNSTTTTAANLIKKNKASLKYNYIVYLRDGTEHNSTNH